MDDKEPLQNLIKGIDNFKNADYIIVKESNYWN